MDVFQLIVTTAAVIIVILLMVYFACHLFGPKANAWIRSTREEKIGLSHKKVYNANGFLVSTQYNAGLHDAEFVQHRDEKLSSLHHFQLVFRGIIKLM